MKKLNILPLILLITILFFQSCDNEDELQDPFPNTWKLDRTKMEITGNANVVFVNSPGNTKKTDSIYYSKDGRSLYMNLKNHIYKFKLDGSLLFSSDKYENSGTYSISKNSINIEFSEDSCQACLIGLANEIIRYDNSSLVLEANEGDLGKSIEDEDTHKVGVKFTYYFSR